jgi:ribosomal RNA-processing protein 9
LLRYGHQDSISEIDTLSRERCVSIGQRDRTVRLWKIMEESQLVFEHPANAGGCFDYVTMIDEDNFLTGSDNGYF